VGLTAKVKSMADAFEFGSFRLIIEQRMLLDNGEPVHLSSRAFDILSILLENAGKVVTSAELISRVWPNVVVEPACQRCGVAQSARRRPPGSEVHSQRPRQGVLLRRGRSTVAG
jgi:Transcriptional regulatory protein, C terminal